MPFEVREQNDCVTVRFFGTVTGAELRCAVAEVEHLEQQLGGRVTKRLTDLSTLERIEVGFPEVFESAQRRSERKLPGPIRSAFVAPRPIHVGFVRMFQTLNENPQIEIHIVETLEAAWRWLEGD